MLLDWTRNLDRFAIEHRPPPTQTEPARPHLYRLGHIPKQGVFVIAQDPPSRLLASPDHESVRIARPGARPLVCAPSTHLAALCRRDCSHRHTPRTFACVAANPLPRARPIAGWPHAFPRSASRPRVSGARDNTARARGRLPLNPFSLPLIPLSPLSARSRAPLSRPLRSPAARAPPCIRVCPHSLDRPRV